MQVKQLSIRALTFKQWHVETNVI